MTAIAKRWPLQDAKARLSELVKSASTGGPQEITVRGRSAVVVLARKDYDRLSRPKPSFVEFIRRSPLAGVALPLRRDRSRTRRVAL